MGGWLTLIDEAIGDFARQSFPDRELLVLEDGTEATGMALAAVARAYPQGWVDRPRCAEKRLRPAAVDRFFSGQQIRALV
jgi:hypothetical protein